MNPVPTTKQPRRGAINALQSVDFPIHGWYRFVLSYPPHLVRDYLERFGAGRGDIVFDPFCGTGTTLVEAKKHRLESVGCDAHPFAAMVSRVKSNWSLDARHLRRLFRSIIKQAGNTMSGHGLEALSFAPMLLGENAPNGFALNEDQEHLMPTGFVSPRPLHRLLMLRDDIEAVSAGESEAVTEFFLVALAHVIANGAGNFAFGPEIYRTKAKPDYDVLGHFSKQCDLMIQQLAAVQGQGLAEIPAMVFEDDARGLTRIPENISCVITSPPYPNEKDYTRTTRVESVLLRILSDKLALREVKNSLLRSNTRNVFVDDTDSNEVAEFASIRRVCQAIERRRIELEKDSGFERLYHKVVAHYFGGMRRHFRALRPKLRRKARLAYVVGDQLSFLMVHVATARLLAEVAASEGFKEIDCVLWRERVGTKVRNSTTDEKTVRVREEILVLEKR